MRKEVREFITWAEGLGWKLEGMDGRGHYRMRLRGHVKTLPATPSDHRSLLNSKVEMRRLAGVSNDGPSAARYRNRKVRQSNFKRSDNELALSGHGDSLEQSWLDLDDRLDRLRDDVAARGRTPASDAECVRLALARSRVEERLRAIHRPIPGSNLPRVNDLVKEIENEV